MDWASLMDHLQRWRESTVPGRGRLRSRSVALVAGCETPSAHTVSRNFGLRGDVPVDPPRPPATSEDDCAEGGRLYKLYCGSCHNARPLGERPFSNYNVAVAHMRDQAYLHHRQGTRQIIMFLHGGAARRRSRRRLPVGPSPKRLVFPQPISELRPAPRPRATACPPPPPGAGPFQQPGAAPVQLPPIALPPAIQ